MRRALVLLVAALAAATPASAQLKPETQTGSLMAGKPQAVDPAQAAIVRKDFARCAYYAAKPKVLALLAHSDMETVDARSAGIKDYVRDLNLDRCLGKQVGFNENALGLVVNGPILRDLFAEEAYLAANDTAPQLPPDAPPMQFNLISAGQQLDAARGLATFADCAVRRDTAGADALLRTDPASDAERKAAAALAPALGGCLAKGQTLSLKPGNIRALIAFAMWTRFGEARAQ